jgi:hypothetical protein
MAASLRGGAAGGQGLGFVLLDEEERDFVLVQHTLGLGAWTFLAARRSGRIWAVLLHSVAGSAGSPLGLLAFGLLP